MNSFSKKLNYSLHDTCLNEIKLTSDGLNLCFNDGIYNVDSFGRQNSLTSKCNINLKITKFDKEKLFEHIEIYKIFNHKIVEISYYDLCNLFGKGFFDIDEEFYSYFSSSIVISGYINKFKIIIKISEIEDVDFLLQN